MRCLTENCIMRASGLAGTAVYVKISVAVGTPLAKDTCTSVQYVHKKSVSVIKIT